ncbi:MAG TPA: ATP-binding protein [Candidatus Paceibacterota bacterium]|nr:ATP-binding protein [Candidatus Paceibacterota bacterium]
MSTQTARLLIIIAAVLLISASVAGVLIIQLQLKQTAQFGAGEHLHRLQEIQTSRLDIARALGGAAGEFVSASEVVTRDEWQRFSSGQSIESILPSFVALLLIDRTVEGYVVRYAGPSDQGAEFIGTDLFADPLFRGAIEQVNDGSNYATSDVFIGADGNRLVIIFFPFSDESVERGVIGIVRDMQQAMAELVTAFDKDNEVPGVRITTSTGLSAENAVYTTLADDRSAQWVHTTFGIGQQSSTVEVVVPFDFGSSAFGRFVPWWAGITGGLLSMGIVGFLILIERQRYQTHNAVNDATARLRSREVDLREALTDAQRFRQAVEQSADHIIFADPEGTLIYANPAIESVTGFAPREVIGKKVGTSQLWGGQMSKEFYQQLWHTIKVDKLPFRGEIRNRRKDGRFYDAYAVISPILDDAGNLQYFVATERDISREKQLERLQNEFVSITSHQLRTPLGGIRWVAERLMRKEQLSEDGYKYLQDILSSARNLSDLVDLLLNVSRLEQEGGPGVRPEVFEFIRFMEEFLAEMAPVADKKRIALNFSPGDLDVQMQTDRAALRNIVQTYVSNALEYTPAGGRVDIRIDILGDDVRISVRDTGIGIPEETQGRLFTKFSRGENARAIKPGGTGLGLYLTKKAAELLGGTVWFESKEGKGSTFYAQIPKVTNVSGGGGKPLA